MADNPTRQREVAVGLVGTNVVFDYGTEAAAREALERLQTQDERCMACLHTIAPAMRRAAAIRIWAEVRKGRGLKDVLQEFAPGTKL